MQVQISIFNTVISRFMIKLHKIVMNPRENRV